MFFGMKLEGRMMYNCQLLEIPVVDDIANEAEGEAESFTSGCV